ncbi:hypothetical protein Ancab_015082, partial [Ancistrocladus abbreviatus]
GEEKKVGSRGTENQRSTLIKSMVPDLRRFQYPSIIVVPIKSTRKCPTFSNKLSLSAIPMSSEDPAIEPLDSPRYGLPCCHTQSWVTFASPIYA